MLTRDQACMAVNLAMQIEMRAVDFDFILETLSEDPEATSELVEFWLQFNDMTRNALSVLIIEKGRRHLERCWQIQVKEK